MKTLDFFDILTMVGGLCLFLFGMNIMSQALERRAGNKLRSFLGKLTENKHRGLLTGLGVTAVIQSSSALTVMVVGFVNSGLMTLKQSIHVIMGANIGTTVTAWILSLTGIDSGNFFVMMLKPTSFTPILAFAGVILYIFCKDDKKKDTGMILLGFATLMFGMETMADAVSGLKDVAGFQNLFLLFSNPALGVLVGAALTAVIQSSSASVGILQALASTGQVTYGAAVPIIMGQNIGTCVTVLISSVGTNVNAKRAAFIHLFFNVFGSVILLISFCLIKYLLTPVILTETASLFGIAVVHSAFNVLVTLIMLPLSGFLEKLVCTVVPDTKERVVESKLDERLLITPAVALEQCKSVLNEMASCTLETLSDSIEALDGDPSEKEKSIRAGEKKTDYYEDILGSYLVKLSIQNGGENVTAVASKYLRMVGDFERIADYSLSILYTAMEMDHYGITFSKTAKTELKTLTDAVMEEITLTCEAFCENDLEKANQVAPLGQIIDELRDELHGRHINRLQQGNCDIQAGIVISDLLNDLNHIASHGTAVSLCIIDALANTMHTHEELSHSHKTEDYLEMKNEYAQQYKMP